MADRRPLVIINGQVQQLPVGDLVPVSAVPEHNAHDGIQGGIEVAFIQPGLFQTGLAQEGASEYYHLTEAQHTDVVTMRTRIFMLMGA